MAKHYLCKTVTELPAYMQAQFRVQEGTQMHTGDVYLAETLDTNMREKNKNYLTFIPENISDISKQVPAIVLNNSFETLVDGRRPDGNPDYTEYVYQPDEVITAIRLLPGARFEISYDCISNLNDIDGLGYLALKNDSGLLKYVKTLDEVESKVYLVIEALKSFRIGGQSGNEFIDTFVARVEYQKVAAQPVDPEITGIRAEVVQGLQVGNENVASGATVLTMEAQGGTAPYTYKLIPDGEAAQDNDKFVIGSSEVKVGENALTEAKTYKIYVQATDNKGKTYKEGFDIPVAAE